LLPIRFHLALCDESACLSGVSPQSTVFFQAKLLAKLNDDGLVIGSVGEVTPNTSIFEELDWAVRKCELSLADKINEVRSGMDSAGGRKDYLIHFLGVRPALDPTDIFLRFGLQPEILDIVNSYCGMLTKLRSADVWQNVVMQVPAKESQLWHRDWEDRHILKLFVYFTDVDEGSGPFTYAPGTHPKGTVNAAPMSDLVRADARRTNDEQMSQVIPKEKWITAMGPKGTIVLADTMGYHKGGLARLRDRILNNCMFTSTASLCSAQFTCSLPMNASLDRAAAFAIEN
jgi:hypothetical protein